MSKFLKSLIRNPLIAIAVLAAAGNISNFESTPDVSSAVVTPVQARLGMQTKMFSSTKAEKTYEKMIKKETPAEKDLRHCLASNWKQYDFLTQYSKPADHVRSELGRNGMSSLTIGMDDKYIAKVLNRITAYQAQIKDELKTVRMLPEACRPAPVAQAAQAVVDTSRPTIPETTIETPADKAAKMPPVRPTQAVIDVPPSNGYTTTGSVTGGSTTGGSTTGGSDDDSVSTPSPEPVEVVEPVHPPKEAVVSKDPFQDVYDYVRTSILPGAARESRNILKESRYKRDRAITVIAAALKNAVHDHDEEKYNAMLGCGFDDAVARAVQEFVDEM